MFLAGKTPAKFLLCVRGKGNGTWVEPIFAGLCCPGD
jgi:hypothetical protein